MSISCVPSSKRPLRKDCWCKVAVYVDSERNQFGRMRMCHMVADTLTELHSMANKIGLKRMWFQQSRSGVPHYDVSLSKRSLAISFGAVVVDRRGLVEIMKRFREGNQ